MVKSQERYTGRLGRDEAVHQKPALGLESQTGIIKAKDWKSSEIDGSPMRSGRPKISADLYNALKDIRPDELRPQDPSSFMIEEERPIDQDDIEIINSALDQAAAEAPAVDTGRIVAKSVPERKLSEATILKFKPKISTEPKAHAIEESDIIEEKPAKAEQESERIFSMDELGVVEDVDDDTGIESIEYEDDVEPAQDSFDIDQVMQRARKIAAQEVSDELRKKIKESARVRVEPQIVKSNKDGTTTTDKIVKPSRELPSIGRNDDEEYGVKPPKLKSRAVSSGQESSSGASRADTEKIRNEVVFYKKDEGTLVVGGEKIDLTIAGETPEVYPNGGNIVIRYEDGASFVLIKEENKQEYSLIIDGQSIRENLTNGQVVDLVRKFVSSKIENSERAKTSFGYDQAKALLYIKGKEVKLRADSFVPQVFFPEGSTNTICITYPSTGSRQPNFTYYIKNEGNLGYSISKGEKEIGPFSADRIAIELTVLLRKDELEIVKNSLIVSATVEKTPVRKSQVAPRAASGTIEVPETTRPKLEPEQSAPKPFVVIDPNSQAASTSAPETAPVKKGLLARIKESKLGRALAFAGLLTTAGSLSGDTARGTAGLDMPTAVATAKSESKPAKMNKNQESAAVKNLTTELKWGGGEAALHQEQALLNIVAEHVGNKLGSGIDAKARAVVIAADLGEIIKQQSANNKTIKVDGLTLGLAEAKKIFSISKNGIKILDETKFVNIVNHFVDHVNGAGFNLDKAKVYAGQYAKQKGTGLDAFQNLGK